MNYFANKSTRVLLIEDDEVDAVLFRRSLSACRRSYDLRECASMALAIEWLQDNHCDVILLDMHLPDSQGLEGIQEIHQHFADVPIVIA